MERDWRKLAAYEPFALLFADGGRAKERDPEGVLALVRPAGLIVLDDLTPEDQWTPNQRAA